MTVTAEAAVPGVDRDVVDQQFTEIYTECFERLQRHIYFRLPLAHVHVAEDLAQETFIQIWKDMKKGKLNVRESLFGLLCFLSHQRIASYFRRMTNATQRPLDFGDPANVHIISGHRYAPFEPGLATLSADLDAAMERMQEASKTWRNLHGLVYRDRQALVSGVAGRMLTPQTRRLKEERLAASEQAEPKALTRFQEACMQVARLRGELEAAAPYWNSSAGMAPATVSIEETHKQRHGVRSDVSLTHCHNGHRLTRDNIHFDADGGRRCRPCDIDQGRKRADRTGVTAYRPTTADEVIDAARALLMDPSKDDLTFKQAAEVIGLSERTLSRHLPEVVAVRRERRGNRPFQRTDPAVWERVRTMLLDPHNGMTVEQIAHAAGLNFTVLYKRVPEVLAQRAATRRSRSEAAEQAARKMLLDPTNTMPITRIAAAAGMPESAVYKRLSDAVSVRRERLAAAKKSTRLVSA